MLHRIYRHIKPLRRSLNLLSMHMRVGLLHARKRKIVFLLGIPEHNNIGDLAITEAEISFIRQRHENIACVTVPYRVISAGTDFLTKIANDDDIIAGHGGGNMGDTYLYEEITRRSIINAFPNNKIVIFPQTLYFSDSAIGTTELEKTQSVYSSHKRLTIVAREKTSYESMCKYFPNNTVLLTPDIVLSMSRVTPQRSRKGALICFRSDIESKIDADSYKIISMQCAKRFGSITVTDTVEKGWLYRLKPDSFIINQKLKQFKSAEIVVTDRLHGMVFAAITGTPCIVFSNFNHKVKGVYDWVKDLGYIKYCDSIDDFSKVDLAALTSSTNTYNPNRFSAYWELLDRELSKRSEKR